MKTHKSDVFFEFAKCLFLNGHEITPFPISALKECGKDVSALTNLFISLRDKGWEFSSAESSVYTFYGMVKNLPSRVCNAAKFRSRCFENIYSMIRGFQLTSPFLNELGREYCKFWIPLDETRAIKLFNLMVQTHFLTSLKKTALVGDSSIPLKELFYNLAFDYNLYRDHTIKGINLPVYRREKKDIPSEIIRDFPTFLALVKVSMLYGKMEDLLISNFQDKAKS